MPKMIQIRNVPDDLHARLRAAAAKKSLTLSDYIKQELAQIATTGSWEAFEQWFHETHDGKDPKPESLSAVAAIREAREENDAKWSFSTPRP